MSPRGTLPDQVSSHLLSRGTLVESIWKNVRPGFFSPMTNPAFE